VRDPPGSPGRLVDRRENPARHDSGGDHGDDSEDEPRRAQADPELEERLVDRRGIADEVDRRARAGDATADDEARLPADRLPGVGDLALIDELADRRRDRVVGGGDRSGRAERAAGRRDDDRVEAAPREVVAELPHLVLGRWGAEAARRQHGQVEARLVARIAERLVVEPGVDEDVRREAEDDRREDDERDDR
jgi:hypothetical protein